MRDEKSADANGLFDVLGSYSRASVPDIPTLCRTSADLLIRSVLCLISQRGSAKTTVLVPVTLDMTRLQSASERKGRSIESQGHCIKT